MEIKNNAIPSAVLKKYNNAISIGIPAIL